MRSLEAGPSRKLGIQHAKQLAGAPVLPLCVPTATAEAQAGSTRPSLSLAVGLIRCASLTCCLGMKQQDVRVADGGALLQVLTSRWRARCDAPHWVAVPVLRAVEASTACIHLSTTGSSLYWASTVLHRASSVARTYVRLAAATMLRVHLQTTFTHVAFFQFALFQHSARPG